MPKPQAIQLNILKPCNQSWDAMTPAQDGRFCNECSKTVIDFSGWSDEALYQFFAKNKTTVCGRFLNTQLNTPIRIPHQPHSRLYRICIALGLTLICTQTPALLAQNRPPKVAQSSGIVDHTQAGINAEPGLGAIYGQIVDEKKEPLVNATVQVCQNGLLMGGNITDYDGNYLVKRLKQGAYDMLISSIGYDTVTIKSVQVNASDSVVQNVAMLTGATYKSNPAPFLVFGNLTFHTRLHGTIKDGHKKPVPYATVRIYNDDILWDAVQADERGTIV